MTSLAPQTQSPEKSGRPPLLRITDKAFSAPKSLMEARKKAPLGLRLSLKTKGCSDGLFPLLHR